MSGINLSPGETRIDAIVAAIRALVSGRSNAVGVVTLNLGQATTVVNFPNCGPQSQVILEAHTAQAAAERAAGVLRISSITAGTFTITHANNANTDRVFGFICLG